MVSRHMWTEFPVFATAVAFVADLRIDIQDQGNRQRMILPRQPDKHGTILPAYGCRIDDSKLASLEPDAGREP